MRHWLLLLLCALVDALRLPAHHTLSYDIGACRRSVAPVALFSSTLFGEVAGAEATPTVDVRSAMPDDAVALADLCTDAFFGTHSFSDGPIIFLQRTQIYSRVLMQVSRRLRLEDGRECRLLVAIDSSSGKVCGCVDLAIHLYNERQKRFELTIDEMPEGPDTYSWQPYVASLAVREQYRRRGVARRLMQEAERIAKRWGYNQIFLEVAQRNDAALRFYQAEGYGMVREDSSGTGATEVVVRPFFWDVRSVEKFILRRSLGALW